MKLKKIMLLGVVASMMSIPVLGNEVIKSTYKAEIDGFYTKAEMGRIYKTKTSDGEVTTTNLNLVKTSGREYLEGFEGSGPLDEPEYYVENPDTEYIEFSTPYAIIGRDDRETIYNTERFPYSAVVQLEIQCPTGEHTGWGTGFMVGPDKILTAGHNLYFPLQQDDCGAGWASNIIAYPGKNEDELPFGSARWSGMTVPNEYIKTAKTGYPDLPFDYGILTVSSNIGNRTGVFSLQVPSGSLKGEDISILGYPGWSDSRYFENQVIGNGSISEHFKFENLIYYDVDTTRGQSGSPILLDRKSYAKGVVGIHSQGDPAENMGVAINSDMLFFIE